MESGQWLWEADGRPKAVIHGWQWDCIPNMNDLQVDEHLNPDPRAGDQISPGFLGIATLIGTPVWG